MVWDRGNYYVYGEQPVKSLRDGKLHLVLDGDKAKGEWTLVRIRGRDEAKNQCPKLNAVPDGPAACNAKSPVWAKPGRDAKPKLWPNVLSSAATMRAA